MVLASSFKSQVPGGKERIGSDYLQRAVVFERFDEQALKNILEAVQTDKGLGHFLNIYNAADKMANTFLGGQRVGDVFLQAVYGFGKYEGEDSDGVLILPTRKKGGRKGICVVSDHNLINMPAYPTTLTGQVGRNDLMIDIPQVDTNKHIKDHANVHLRKQSGSLPGLEFYAGIKKSSKKSGMNVWLVRLVDTDFLRKTGRWQLEAGISVAKAENGTKEDGQRITALNQRYADLMMQLQIYELHGASNEIKLTVFGSIERAEAIMSDFTDGKKRIELINEPLTKKPVMSQETVVNSWPGQAQARKRKSLKER